MEQAMIERMDNDCLIREYLDLNKARFGLFGNNAAMAQTKVAAELIKRGVTQIPNIFGPIPVR